MKEEDILEIVNKSQRLMTPATRLDEFHELNHEAQIIINACEEAEDTGDAWNAIESSIEELRRAQTLLGMKNL